MKYLMYFVKTASGKMNTTNFKEIERRKDE